MNYKTLIIHNPKAGKRKKINLLSFLKQHASFNYDYIETKYAKHAKELALEAVKSGYELVIAAGGDGTVNEVASSLVNTKVTLGIIPLGSGNGLARQLKVPIALKKGIRFINHSKSKQIDYGSINGNLFFCAGGVGFDAEVSNLFAKSNTRGLRSYLKLGLQKYLAYAPKVYSVLHDNSLKDEKAFLITFANAQQFGNNAYIAPHAKIDDGYFDVCILKPFPFYIGLFLFIKLFNKKIGSSKYYKSFTSNSLQIDLKEINHYHCDGEVFEDRNIEVKIINKGLLVLTNL